MEFQSKVIYVANFYASSAHVDRLAWLENVTDVFENNPSIPSVDSAGGDWNSVIKRVLDRDGGVRDHRRDAKDSCAMHSFLESMSDPVTELIDGWRVLHSNEYDYTHENRGRAAYSRTDRLYVRSDWIDRRMDSWAIESPGAVHTDHRASLDVGVRSEPRGEGIWKMSPALLDYPIIVKELEDIASQSPVGRDLEGWLVIKA